MQESTQARRLPKARSRFSSQDRLQPWETIRHYSRHIQKIYKILSEEFGKVKTPLSYHKEYELGIAVILSAQCTDERVNQVTPALFQAFPTLESFAKADLKELETYIFSTGFYRNKARSIQGYAKVLLERFGGRLPKTLEELTQLPGFGRKTANVVLSAVHGIAEGFVVDTHVKRIAYRLGLTRYKDPIRIEREIMEKVPQPYWDQLSLYLIFHGRKTCYAKKPNCSECRLRTLCPSSSV